MDVIVDADCGNAPKKAVVRDYLIAAAEGDLAGVAEAVCESVRWEVVGVETHHGRDAVVAALTGQPPISRFRIGMVLSHGKHVAAEGDMGRDDGGVTRFAHLICFDGHGKNAEISEIVTFAVPVA